MRSTRNLVRAIASLLAASPGIFGAANIHAHVVLEQQEAPAGTSYKAIFRVGHGCEGTGTHTLEVELPDGVVGIKPMPKAGWRLDTVTEKLATPYQSHGRSIDSRVGKLVWSGGLLPDAYYDEFVAMMSLPASPGTLYFKVRQLCETGKNEWVEIPAEGKTAKGLKAPAARLILRAKPSDNTASTPVPHKH